MENDLLERVNRLEARLMAIEEKLNSVSSGGISIHKELSIREFLNLTDHSTQTEKVVLIAYYLENYQSLTSYSIKELTDCFNDAKEPLPTNINSLVNNNIAKGFLKPAKEKEGKLKRFEITNSGIKFVEEKIKKSGETV